MILSAHNFRSHIPRCSTRIAIIIRLNCPSNAHIRNSQVSSLIKDDIFRLDIPMDNIIKMQKLQSH